MKFVLERLHQTFGRFVARESAGLLQHPLLLLKRPIEPLSPIGQPPQLGLESRLAALQAALLLAEGIFLLRQEFFAAIEFLIPLQLGPPQFSDLVIRFGLELDRHLLCLDEHLMVLHLRFPPRRLEEPVCFVTKPLPVLRAIQEHGSEQGGGAKHKTSDAIQNRGGGFGRHRGFLGLANAQTSREQTKPPARRFGSPRLRRSETSERACYQFGSVGYRMGRKFRSVGCAPLGIPPRGQALRGSPAAVAVTTAGLGDLVVRKSC